jgi:cyclic pyranopterin phosphate synthase
MRDITHKVTTLRQAMAQSVLTAAPETLQRIRDGQIPKGDPLPVAKVAAIMAAKNTHGMIPYCHPIHVEHTEVAFTLTDDTIVTTVTVKSVDKTGVEMEALTAASVAALTLYDMLKMLDDTMTIRETVLCNKTGGKSDYQQVFASRLKAAVLVMSDSVATGKKSDRSGRLIAERLEAEGLTVVELKVVSDDPDEIRAAMLGWTDTQALDIIVTTGGTGMSPRDNTPEAMASIFERTLPGVAEAVRSYGQARTPYAMLSRATAGVRGKTLILNFPGSTGGVRDALDALFPAILHSFKMLWGFGHASEQALDAAPVPPKALTMSR